MSSLNLCVVNLLARMEPLKYVFNHRCDLW